MTPRRRRLVLVLGIVAGVSVAGALALSTFRQDVTWPPGIGQPVVVHGEPRDQALRKPPPTASAALPPPAEHP